MRFLILNHDFRDYTGSEINALQLGAGLVELGHAVEIGTFAPGEPMVGRARRSGLRVVDLLASAELGEFDVIWAHHAPVLTHVLFHRRPRDCRIVFSTLSPLTPLESPPTYWVELPCILAHSPFNRDYLLELGAAASVIREFPNCAPRSFFSRPKTSQATRLGRIAVVSHHPPREVREMAKLARAAGVKVDFIGGGRRRYVDEHVLPAYDLVVAIGKTAPYCFAQRVPYYCYDHFGGPGYLTPENFEKARHGSFCGRSFWRKLPAADLWREMAEGYPGALGQLDHLEGQARQRFELETNLKRLCAELPSLPECDVAGMCRRHGPAGRLNDVYVASFVAHERSFTWRVTRPLRALGRRWQKSRERRRDGGG